jgi:hypothetical protein
MLASRSSLHLAVLWELIDRIELTSSMTRMVSNTAFGSDWWIGRDAFRVNVNMNVNIT